MIKHSKRTLSFCLALALIVGMVAIPPVSAEEITVPKAAQHLFEDGVITYIDEKFNAGTCPDGWEGGTGFADNVADITTSNLRYNGNDIPDLKNYTVSAEFTISSNPGKNAYYTLSIARYEASTTSGIECAIVWHTDNKWYYRVWDRNAGSAFVKEAALPSTVGADFNKPIKMEASIYNNHFSFFINDVCITSQKALPDFYIDGGLFSFWSQQSKGLTVDNVKVTGYKTNGRNKLLIDDLCGRDTYLGLDKFYAYKTGVLDGAETNPYYHGGTGRQFETVTIDNKEYYQLKSTNVFYAAEEALSWKNYNVEATLHLAVKNSTPTDYNGSRYAGITFGAKQNPDNAAMRNLGVCFVIYYQYNRESDGTFTYKVIDIDTNKTVRQQDEVPDECGLTFDPVGGSSIFTIRASIFDNTVYCYINEYLVCKVGLSDTLEGTCGICMNDTKTLTDILGFKVVGEYTMTPEERDEPYEIFFEDFNDRTRGQMTTSGTGLWDFSNQAAAVYNTSSITTMGYFNEISYKWCNCIYEADYTFTYLPKTYTDLGRTTSNDYTAYYTLALTDGGDTTAQSVLEFRLRYEVKKSGQQDNYWRMELFLRGKENTYYANQGLDNKSAAVTLDASNPAIQKLSSAQTVKFKVITRDSKLAAIYFDDYKAPFSDAIISEYNAYTGNYVHGAPLYAMMGNSNAGWVVDNVRILQIPETPELKIYDFNDNTYEVGDKPISLFDGWDDDSDNEIVELDDGKKALKADKSLKWYGNYDNVRASFTFSVKGNLTEGTFNSIDYFPRLQIGDWYNAAVGLRANYSGLAFNDTPYFQALYDMRAMKGKARNDAEAAGKLTNVDADDTAYINELLINYYLDIADDFKAENADDVHVFTITKIGGYYKTEIDGITVGEHMANENDYSSCLLGALPVVFEVGTNEGSGENIGIAVREKTTYIHKIEIEDLTEKLRTVGLGNYFKLIELPSANIAGLPSGDKFTSAREENAFLAGDTVAIRANDGVKIKAGTLRYVDENEDTGNIFISANGKLGDGRSFIFTMPDCNVTSIVYDSMGEDTLSFAVVAASRSLTDNTALPHAVRFLHRVYLGGRKGNGYSSSVVYNGINYTITDIGAAIVPKDVFDGEFNESSLLNTDIRIMKVSLFDHGKLYDSTDTYIDFTLRMNNIPADDRVYRCCTYVKLKDGAGTEIYVFGDAREASFDSLK